MRYLTEKEAELAELFINRAAEVARKSTCLRAFCGAVIVKDGQIISEGFNGPPQNDPRYRTCLDEYELPQNFRHDRTCCIHAEQRAVDEALRQGRSSDLQGAWFYFVRVDATGDKLRAGKPKCTICSRLTLEHGLTGFVLWDEGGYALYEPDEFNRLSYAYGERPGSL